MNLRLVVGALAAGALAFACEETAKHPGPELLTLEDLVAIASDGGAYIDQEATLPDGGTALDDAGTPLRETVVPMRAVVTPPGQEIFFRSPPFAPAATTNASTGPQLNVLPGLAEGRAIPYTTLELWKNEFGPIWIQPMYFLHKASTPNALAQGIVFGTSTAHRFYSPFWRVFHVVVPDAVGDALATTPVKSVAEVMALGGTITVGGLGLCPIVPDDTELDPALLTPAGQTPAEGSFPGVWDAVYRAEYTDTGLSKLIRPSVARKAGFVEGRTVSVVTFGAGSLYRELPGEVVESVPIFMWVDKDAQGRVRPLAMPTIGAHAPLRSGRAVEAPNGRPDWFALWELVQVVRPAGAEPYLPGSDGDAFAGIRALWKARVPASEVQALPGVIRYLGRLALNPACFESAAAAATGDPDAPLSTSKWAATCRFVDSQDEIEALVDPTALLHTGVQVLCPFLLWAPAAEVRP